MMTAIPSTSPVTIRAARRDDVPAIVAMLADDHLGQARERVEHYEHREVGYNYRLSNVLAALGRVQLARLPQFIERRRQVNMLYRHYLGGLHGLECDAHRRERLVGDGERVRLRALGGGCRRLRRRREPGDDEAEQRGSKKRQPPHCSSQV